MTVSSIVTLNPSAAVATNAPYAPPGPIIAGTSLSAVTIDTIANKTFTLVEFGLGFRAGVRARAAVATALTEWIEGIVVSYDANRNLVLAPDLVHGGGTFSNWIINVAGEPGEKGDTGAAGAQGLIAEAPTDGAYYARQSAGWTNINAAYAPLASPIFTGNPRAPTATAGDSDTSIATTAFVQAAIAIAPYAPLDSPTFTGDPKAPTPAPGDNDTSIATTAFVAGALAGYQPLDGDLTSLASAGSTNSIYYRSAANTWAPVTIGASMSFSGGVLDSAVSGGNVSNSGAPTNGQLAQWTDATHIQGIAVSSLGYAPLASPALTGNPTAPTPTVGDNDTSIATTAFVTNAVAGGAASVPRDGRLTYVSATALSFAPYGGNKIKINGTLYTIPNAGIAGLTNTGIFINGVAGQNLSASTFYRVYAFINSSVVTADFRTAAVHATSTTAGNEGVEILSGDDTRSLIGMCRTDAASQFADSVTQRFVASWFNRRNRGVTNTLSVTKSTTSATAIELESARRLEFMQWIDEDLFWSVSMTVYNSAANSSNYGGIGFDGIAAEAMSCQMLVTSGTPGPMPMAASAIKSGLAEGYHYAALLGWTNGNTATFQVPAGTGGHTGFSLITRL